MIRPGRQRRIVFYVGSYLSFREYVHGELSKLANPRTGDPVVEVKRMNGGREWSIERGRRFVYLGNGWGDCTTGMRGLSASGADIVYGADHRANTYRQASIREHAAIVTAGATDEERQRETDINEAMARTGEPYEIVVEFFEAHDACNDYPDEEP